MAREDAIPTAVSHLLGQLQYQIEKRETYRYTRRCGDARTSQANDALAPCNSRNDIGECSPLITVLLA